MSGRAAASLREIERRKASYEGDGARKLSLLADLEASPLRTPRELRRLHEVLCFLRAYPDDRAVLERVERMLAGFESRRDFRRQRGALADSGIAGTVTHFRFFAPTAFWLARRWPERLEIDWRELDEPAKLEPFLPLFALPAESPGLDEVPLSVRRWIARMKGPAETDAAFLLRCFAALPASPALREAIYDALDPPLLLRPGPGTPSRTHAIFRSGRVHFQTRPPARARPDLLAEIARPPRSVRSATRREARSVIELARAMMVTLHRDLDVFSYASEHDVRLADCGEGLTFAFIGFAPERRLLLESLYGYLILKNGVPLGYGTIASLFRSSEVAYNVSETFRGGEAAHVFARLLACVRTLFGSDTFSLDSYQLGEGNDEAIRSGAWWFYQKLGFRPEDPSSVELMRKELSAMQKAPGHRSSAPTLRTLAQVPLFLRLGRPRREVLGALQLGNVGLRVMGLLAERFGSERERAPRVASREAARRLGVGALARFARAEREAWERWSPLLLALPGIERWSAAERRALVEVVRAKGGRRESTYQQRFDAHPRLRRALAALATERATGVSAQPRRSGSRSR